MLDVPKTKRKFSLNYKAGNEGTIAIKLILSKNVCMLGVFQTITKNVFIFKGEV